MIRRSVETSLFVWGLLTIIKMSTVIRFKVKVQIEFTQQVVSSDRAGSLANHACYIHLLPWQQPPSTHTHTLCDSPHKHWTAAPSPHLTSDPVQVCPPTMHLFMYIPAFVLLLMTLYLNVCRLLPLSHWSVSVALQGWSKAFWDPDSSWWIFNESAERAVWRCMTCPQNATNLF